MGKGSLGSRSGNTKMQLMMAVELVKQAIRREIDRYQVHLSVYGVPMHTAILARSIASGSKTDLAFSSSPKCQIAPANLASDPQVARSM